MKTRDEVDEEFNAAKDDVWARWSGRNLEIEEMKANSWKQWQVEFQEVKEEYLKQSKLCIDICTNTTCHGVGIPKFGGLCESCMERIVSTLKKMEKL